MKKVVMFSLDTCPHCKRAIKMVQALKDKNPEYKDVQIEIIDEDNRPAEYKELYHEYVPAYYVDGEEVFDGVPNFKLIEEVLKRGMD